MAALKSAGKGSVSIELEGRIDSGNAEENYKAIRKLRDENPQGKLIFYCDKLNYLSSAGLRVFLRLQKSEKKRIVMRHVRQEVAEILIMTGFHKILLIEKLFQNIHLPNGQIIEKVSSECAAEIANLSPGELSAVEEQLREIDVEDCEVVGKGTTGCIYRLNGEDIVKVYNKGIPLTAVLKEVVVSKRAFIWGLPTAISYDVVKVGDCYGAVFEMIGGETLASAIRREPENYEYYAARYAALFRTLHNTAVEENIFSSAKQNFLEAAEKCTKYYSAEEIELIKKMISDIPDRNTLIHRDYHPKNIMVSDGKLLLIDMADVCIGHPDFDWMGIIATHRFFAAEFPEATEQNTGMDPELCSKLRNSLFHMYYIDKNQAEIEEMKRQAERMSRILLGISPALRPEQPEEINRICVEEARKCLLTPGVGGEL